MLPPCLTVSLGVAALSDRVPWCCRACRDGKDGTPHYSLYSRNADPNRFAVPGPGAYSPEATGPSGKPMAARYSFGIRHRSRRTDQTPGEPPSPRPPSSASSSSSL